MTAVKMEDAIWKFVEGTGFSLFIVVDSRSGECVDVSRGTDHSSNYIPGTINIWIFKMEILSEEAYIQAIATATEAKVKSLHDMKIMDPLTGKRLQRAPLQIVSLSQQLKTVKNCNTQVQ